MDRGRFRDLDKVMEMDWKKKGKHEERELHREIRPQPSEVWTTATKNAKVNIFKHAVYTELVTPQCNGLHNRLTDKESLA